MIGGEGKIGAILLQQMQHPMAEFDVAIARALGLPQRLNKRFIADPVELARDRLDTDVCAHFPAPDLARFQQPLTDRGSDG